MKLTDFITVLQKAEDEHGNMTVRVCTSDAREEFTSVDGVSVFDKKDRVSPPSGTGDHVWISLHNA